MVGTAQAQLISPGKLTRAHQDLEGIRNCTSCHALRSQGIDNARCLGCHTPLKTRIGNNRGFHASVAEQNCADCHKEHFGPDFDLVRLDTDRFDHAKTGYRLTGEHTQASCRNCHRPALITANDVRSFKGRNGALNRTFLGLATRCQTCHEPDSPHEGQFSGEDCATCHATDAWEDADGFDHNDARFKLIGQHRQVTCGGCHPEATASDGDVFTRFEGISFATCSSCHTDAHGGAFGADCQGCHNPTGWHQIRNFSEDRFDHTATGFTLEGSHARLDCAVCHNRPARHDDEIQLSFVRGTERHTYPRIRVENCLSCHTDLHEGTFAETPGGAICENCHTQTAWFPASFGLERHNAETRFELTGAHLATPCSACHHTENAPPRFEFAALTCESCHADDNPHGIQFARAGATVCADCHTTDGWTLDDDFDHDATGFALTGLHATIACASCHTTTSADGPPVRQFRGLPTTCEGCHAEDNPHQGQFDDRTCDTCHTTDGFQQAAETFDHATTRFPLLGAHTDATCAQCHKPETAPGGEIFLRYRPLSTACKDCHGDG